jgi:phage/plasmid-associated DNA primase
MAGIAHASLLYGPDVAGNFLNLPGARRIKSLVGGELLDCEFKGSNIRATIEGVFNILISSNARLRLYIHSDRSAWERRLIVVRYEVPFKGVKVPEIHKMLLREEGPGIVNWCIQGAELLLQDIKDHGDIHLSNKQKGLVQKMLNESDSLRIFLKTQMVGTLSDNDDLTTDEIIEAYGKYCRDQGWDNLPASVIQRRLPDHMVEIFSAVQSENLKREGKRARGYRRVRWRTEDEE